MEWGDFVEMYFKKHPDIQQKYDKGSQSCGTGQLVCLDIIRKIRKEYNKHINKQKKEQ